MKEIFERYLYAGAVMRDPDAVAALFTSDGVYEVPLAGVRLEGPDAIRAGIGRFQTDPRPVNFEKSRSVLHQTADPDIFMAEIDAAFTDGGTMALLQIFRLRDGKIAHLRDYFDPR